MSSKKSSEDHFRSIFEHCPVGMALVGLDLRIIDVNPTVCTIIGYTKEELVGRKFGELVHPDESAVSLANAAKLFTGQVPTVETDRRYIRKDGEVVWVHIVAGIIRGAFGIPKCILAVLENVSGRKEAERELRERTAELERLNSLMLNRELKMVELKNKIAKLEKPPKKT